MNSSEGKETSVGTFNKKMHVKGHKMTFENDSLNYVRSKKPQKVRIYLGVKLLLCLRGRTWCQVKKIG